MDDDRKILDSLKDLIKLDFDAIEAYEAAVKRVDDESLRNRLVEFMHDHERHTVNLSEEMRRLGGTPPAGPGLMRMLTEGSVLLGAMLEDRGVLKAMSKNEAVTNRAYEKALREMGNHSARQIVEQNREDERRHKAWIDHQLEVRGGEAIDPGAIQTGRHQDTKGRSSDLR